MPARFSWSQLSVRPVAFAAMFFAVSLSAFAQAPAPLHQRIDQLVNAAPLGPLAPVCSDAEFLRRVSLDLNGLTPTGSEAKAFLDDPAPDKRQKLIEKLLASPRFARHMANTFDVMLMERRADAHVPSPEWQKYLYESFLANKPYDQLVREIIASDGVDPATRPAAKFFLDRAAEPNLMTRDIGRVFFGRDFQCAQCHDSPLVNDFLQSDYYGVQAFVVRTVMFNDAAAKKQFLGEKADGDVAFTSVFTKESGVSVPRVPAGAIVEDPLLPIGEEYNVKPTDKSRPVPKYSRRAKLAEAITATNSQFNRNIANRLWAVMLGRGIVHPLDLHHSDNPPSHPELLDLLTAEVVAAKYDVQTILREIALTQTYQRSGELPVDWNSASQQAAALLATLDVKKTEFEAAIDQAKEAAKQPESEFDSVKKVIAPLRDELNKTTAAASEARKQWDAATDIVTKTEAQIAPKAESAKPLAEVASKAAEALAKIPNDADLKKATDFFQARVTALNNEVAALTKTRDTQAAAAKAKEDAFMTAAAAITPVREKWNAEKSMLDAAREKAEAAVVGIQAINANRNVITRRIAGLKTLAGYNEQVAKAAATQAVLVAQQSDLAAAQQTLTQAADEAAKTAAQKTVADLTALLATTQQQAKSDADQLAATREQITQFCSEHFYVASLKPLTPEQLTASTLSATTYIDIQTKNAIAEIDKAAQTAAAANPSVVVPLPLGGRERQIEENVFEKLLRANAGPFIAMFGGGAGQPQDVFYATADQALFYGNGGTIHNWAGVLAAPLSAQQDQKLLAEDMYLNVLNRRPTDDETTMVTTYLQSRADARVPAIQEMVWGLLSSAEFRFNH